jgi:hypothetical protein
MSKPSAPARDTGPVDPADRGRVFTVTLRDDPTSGVRGRLTHVASGDSAYFDSGDELVTMLQRVGRGV